jgi:hypothetical protein
MCKMIKEIFNKLKIDDLNKIEAMRLKFNELMSLNKMDTIKLFNALKENIKECLKVSLLKIRKK